MFIDIENDDELEMFSKWVMPNSDDNKFHLTLKEDAPVKYVKLFEEVRNRLLDRR